MSVCVNYINSGTSFRSDTQKKDTKKQYEKYTLRSCFQVPGPFPTTLCMVSGPMKWHYFGISTDFCNVLNTAGCLRDFAFDQPVDY